MSDAPAEAHMERLAYRNRERFIDVLAERLGFERTSVKLYEKVLERMRRPGAGKSGSAGDGDYSTYGLSGYQDEDVLPGMSEDIGREQARVTGWDDPEESVVAEMLPLLAACCDQEKEHEAWLESTIRRLGGDPGRKTEMSRLAAREASGIEEVVMKDPEIPHLLHALLAAEHVDGAGWDLLVELAEEAGDREAEAQFEKRLREEDQHVAFLRGALRAFSAHAILGEDLRSPTWDHPSARL